MRTETAKIGHQPITMNRVEPRYSAEPRSSGILILEKPGDFYWEMRSGRRMLVIAVPAPLGYAGGFRDWAYSRWEIADEDYPNRSVTWKWNGDEDKPTLDPSLDLVSIWHGWVRQGVLKEA